MNAYLKLCACVLPVMLAGMPAYADSGDLQQNVTSAGNQKVVSSFGDCVRTKWQSDHDACASGSAKAETQIPEVELGERTVYFGFNKYALTPDSVAKLNALIGIISRSKAITHVTVVGYTDAIGTESYNMALSRKRAETVERYLAAHVSIPTNVLMVKGDGDAAPVTDCAPKMPRKQRIACLAKDRRVEVRFHYEE